ncbi:MAG TPA: hypothetical protein VLH08_15820 [Acidobacteriota bacterium]|nr:hypothetical protein [Acidobacteriota bacterium]
MIIHLQSQRAPLAAFDTLNNRYFVAWNHTDDFVTYRIQGQLFGSNGATLTPIFEFDKSITARLSDVTYNSVTREFLISWITEKNLWTRQITSDGQSASGNIRIANFAERSSVNSFRVIFNPVLNEYLAVFDISKGSRSIIYLQRLDHFGKPVRRPFQQAGYKFINPRVEHDPESNRYLLAWESQTFGFSRILYRTFNAFLQPLHKHVELKSPSNEEVLPRPVYHPRLRQFVLFFQDCFACAPLRARTITADGSQGELFQMELGPVDIHDVRYNPRNNGFLVLYETFQEQSPQFARINSGFGISDRDEFITCQPGRQTAYSSLLYNSIRGEFFAIWNFIDFAPSDDDVYAQRIRAIPQGRCN